MLRVPKDIHLQEKSIGNELSVLHKHYVIISFAFNLCVFIAYMCFKWEQSNKESVTRN